MFSEQPGIDQPAVTSVEQSFLALIKRKTPSNRGAGRQYRSKDHVQAQMKVLVSVEMDRFSPEEAPIFLKLGIERRGYGLYYKWVIDNLGPRPPLKKKDSRTLALSYALGELSCIVGQNQIQMKSCFQAFLDRELGRPF
jgi:hypothetical protein